MQGLTAWSAPLPSCRATNLPAPKGKGNQTSTAIVKVTVRRLRPGILLLSATAIALWASACSVTNSTKKYTPISTQPTIVAADPLVAPVEALATLMKEGVEVVKPPGRVFRAPPYLRPPQIDNWILGARSAENRYLLISVPYDPCGGPPVVLNITETDRSVTIVPLVEPPPVGIICAATAVAIGLLIDLGSPLGARQLLHHVPAIGPVPSDKSVFRRSDTGGSQP
jgi:hypothetical protein